MNVFILFSLLIWSHSEPLKKWEQLKANSKRCVRLGDALYWQRKYISLRCLFISFGWINVRCQEILCMSSFAHFEMETEVERTTARKIGMKENGQGWEKDGKTREIVVLEKKYREISMSSILFSKTANAMLVSCVHSYEFYTFHEMALCLTRTHQELFFHSMFLFSILISCSLWHKAKSLQHGKTPVQLDMWPRSQFSCIINCSWLVAHVSLSRTYVTILFANK